MASANLLIAKKIINKYPEVFESLLEFERTKKIPRLYRRKRLNITINENILKDFKSHCKRKNLNISRLIEEKMLDDLKSG